MPPPQREANRDDGHAMPETVLEVEDLLAIFGATIQVDAFAAAT
jgi:hypothetical protein